MKYYGLQVQFIAYPGKRDKLVGILIQAAEMFRSDKACLHYVVSTTSEPNEVWVIETWATKVAHDSSLDAEAIRAVVRQAMPLIASPPSKIELNIVGGKGL